MTPSIVSNPPNVAMFAVVATLTDCLASSPCAAVSTYPFVAASVEKIGDARDVIRWEFSCTAAAGCAI